MCISSTDYCNINVRYLVTLNTSYRWALVSLNTGIAIVACFRVPNSNRRVDQSHRYTSGHRFLSTRGGSDHTRHLPDFAACSTELLMKPDFSAMRGLNLAVPRLHRRAVLSDSASPFWDWFTSENISDINLTPFFLNKPLFWLHQVFCQLTLPFSTIWFTACLSS